MMKNKTRRSRKRAVIFYATVLLVALMAISMLALMLPA